MNISFELEQQIFAELDRMFNDPSPQAWGSATWVRDQIRSKFSLTHEEARRRHLRWVEARNARALAGGD